MMPLPFQHGTHPQLAGQVAGTTGTQIAGQVPVPGVFHPAFPYPCYQPNLNGMVKIPVFYMPGQPSFHHSTAGSTVTNGSDTEKQVPLTNGSVGSHSVSSSAVFPPPRSTNSSFNNGKSIGSPGQSTTIPSASVSSSSRQRLDFAARKSTAHKSYQSRRDHRDHDYKRVLADKWFALQQKKSEHLQRNKQMPTKTLSIPFDPRRWTPKDVHTWLFYTIHMHDIEEADFSYFVMNGKGLCLLSESAFVYRVPNPPADPGGKILYRDLRQRLVRCIRAERAHARSMRPTPNRGSIPRSLAMDHSSRIPAEHSPRLPDTLRTQYLRPPQEWPPVANSEDRSERTLPAGKQNMYHPHMPKDYFVDRDRRVRSTARPNPQHFVTDSPNSGLTRTPSITQVNHSTLPSSASSTSHVHFSKDPRPKLNILHAYLNRDTGRTPSMGHNNPSMGLNPYLEKDTTRTPSTVHNDPSMASNSDLQRDTGHTPSMRHNNPPMGSNLDLDRGTGRIPSIVHKDPSMGSNPDLERETMDTGRTPSIGHNNPSIGLNPYREKGTGRTPSIVHNDPSMGSHPDLDRGTGRTPSIGHNDPSMGSNPDLERETMDTGRTLSIGHNNPSIGSNPDFERNTGRTPSIVHKDPSMGSNPDLERETTMDTGRTLSIGDNNPSIGLNPCLEKDTGRTPSIEHNDPSMGSKPHRERDTGRSQSIGLNDPYIGSNRYFERDTGRSPSIGLNDPSIGSSHYCERDAGRTASRPIAAAHNNPPSSSNPASCDVKPNLLTEKSQFQHPNDHVSSNSSPEPSRRELDAEIPHSSSSPDTTPSSTQTDNETSEKVSIKKEPIDYDSPAQECSSCLVCTAESESKLLENEAFVNKIQSKYPSHVDGKNV
ncbi:uncharacterized protein [Amphiura filiformis]|uniref:uncharacterized protein n=1 Tax=Amphiura filiformis TaxID=82378 RepID=UPI003B217D6E